MPHQRQVDVMSIQIQVKSIQHSHGKSNQLFPHALSVDSMSIVSAVSMAGSDVRVRGGPSPDGPREGSGLVGSDEAADGHSPTCVAMETVLKETVSHAISFCQNLNQRA